MSIKLMDSSLRDGGNVNGWNFGIRTIRGIVADLTKANIDYIEIGYLKNCDFDCNRTLYQTIEQAEQNALFDNGGSSEYSVMVQVDKWDWKSLTPCKGKIKNIRVSFHKTRIGDGMALCRLVMENGYTCHCNPINIMGYSDAELLELLALVNSLQPQYFSIVDTFGAMSLRDMRRVSLILQNNLNTNIKIAVHLHENLGLASALAMEFINQFSSCRDIIIDASLYGIGRVPGNLCIELMVRYLNQEYGAGYDIDAIYDAIDDYVANIKKNFPWGYELAYALSASYNLHRTYAEFLLSKGKLKTNDIRAILAMIPLGERVIYNQSFIEGLYKDYVSKTIDDTKDVEAFVKWQAGRPVVIVASGASLLTCKEKVREIADLNNAAVVSVNFMPADIMVDCAFFTNKKRLSQQNIIGLKGTKLAVTSNLADDASDADFVFDYAKLTIYNELFIEDSVLMLMHLLNMNAGTTICCYTVGYDAIKGSMKHVDEGMELAYSNITDRNIILHEIGHFGKLEVTHLG